jgi:hypothetical protein
MATIESGNNNLQTLDDETQDIYSGTTEVNKFYDLGLTGKVNSPMNVKNVLTGDYPKPHPGTLPTSKKVDVDNYITALKNKSDGYYLSNQDQNSWAPVYSYNASANGNNFYEKYKDMNNWGGPEFHPTHNNEELFNSQTNFLGDIKRTMTQSFFPMVWQGLQDNYTMMNRLFELKNPFEGNVQAARNYAYYDALSKSSKNNLGSFINNLTINFGYTVGIMGTAIAENLIGKGVSALSGLTGAATLGAGASKLALQNLKVGKTAIDGIHTYSSLLEEFGGDINKMRAFYNEANNIGKLEKGLKSQVGQVLNPFSNLTDNYYSILNSANDFSGYAQSLRNMTNTAGAAWRDFRNINLALSESALEAGMIKNTMVDSLTRDFYAKHHRAPSNEEQQDIAAHADAASHETSVMNAGLIYVTNKIAFDNILNPKIGAKGILRQKIADWKTIGGGRFGALGNVGLETATGTWKFYEKGFKNWWSGWKTDPLSKSIWNTVGYLKRNVTEGIQESLQETISAANERYYTEAYYSPSVKKNFISKAAFGKNSTPLSYYGQALKDQFTAEGFSVFASGFAMGSLAGGLNSSMEYLYTKGHQIFDKKGYAEYTQEKTKITDELLNRMNAVTVEDFLSSRMFNSGTQETLSGIQARANKKELKDSHSEAMIEHINMLMDYGVYDMYIDNFKSYQQMNNDEFEEAFPQIPKGEGGKYKAKIDGVIEEAGKIKDLRNFYNAKFPNPIDLTRFDKSDYDYEDAFIMHHMWNDAVKTAVFYNKSWEDVKGRMVKILDTNYSERPLQKMTKRDSDIILRIDEAKNEIGLLKNEINTLSENTDPESKKLATKKAQKLKDLEEYVSVHNVFDNYYHRDQYREAAKRLIKKNRPENEKDLEITEDEIDNILIDEFGPKSEKAEEDILLNLEAAYNKLMRNFADQNDDYLFTDKVDESFQLVLDYYKLNAESRSLVDHINLLNDPNGFIDVYKRNLSWMNKLWTKRGDYYNDIIKEEFSNIEDNSLLNNLAQMGIFMESSDFIRWRDEGIPPKEFYDERKGLVIPEGSQAYDRYMYKLEMAQNLKTLESSMNKINEENKDARVQQLLARKQSQLAKVKDQFEEDIVIETGSTEEELRKLEDDANLGETASVVNGQIADLNSQIKLIQDTNSVEELIALHKVFEEQGLLPENFDILIEQALANNPDEVKKFFKSTKDSGAPIEARQQATGLKFGLPFALNIKVDELKAKETVEDVIKVESTKSWNDYQTAVAQIEERYDRYLQKLTDDLTPDESLNTKNFTERKDEIEVNTSMNWEDLPEDFKNQLEPLFKTYVTETLKKSEDFESIDPKKYALIRQNWFEKQTDLINQYNKTPLEKKSFVPELKYIILEKPITSYGPTELRYFKNKLESTVDKGYKTDANNNQVTLTASDKVAARADIKALDEYLNYIRVTYTPKNNADRVFRIFEEMVINKQNNVKRELDENGNVIGYTFPGKDGKPMRVTKYTEEIEIDMSGKEPFLYDAIKEQYTDEKGKVKGGQLLNLFRSVSEDTDIKAEERLNEFMRRLEADVRAGSLKQLNSPRKLNKIREALTNNFSEEALIAIVKGVAFDESTIAGNTVDNMARIALKRNPSGKGFMVPNKPEKMSQEAYDAIFGKDGIITKIQEQVIDGKYELLTDDVLIYDESLLDNGIVGAMDIVAFDKSTGKFSIIDIKTGNENSWNNFTKEGGKLLNYRIQQTVYRNIAFNMTGELAEKLSLLPILISVDMDGNILTAESAARIINKSIIRDLKNQLLAAEESSRPNDSNIKSLKQQIENLEKSDTVALKPVEEVESKYGIKMIKPTLPNNLQENAYQGKEEEISQDDIKKKIKTTKSQITATQKKLDGLKDGGVLVLGDVVTMSPLYDNLMGKMKALKESLTKLEGMLETNVPKETKKETPKSDLDTEIEALKLMKDGVQISGEEVGAPTIISIEEFNNYIDGIIKARTLEELESAYSDAVIMIVSEPELTFGNILRNAYEIKKKGLVVNVAEQNLAKGEYLISKIPIFTENADEIVVVFKVGDGKVTVKQIGVNSPKQKTFTNADLNSKFNKTTKEALEQKQEEEPMSEEQKINSEISKTSTKDFAGNKDLIATAKEKSKLSRKDRLAALKDINKDDNINNCKPK